MSYKIYRKGSRSVEVRQNESSAIVCYYIAGIKVNEHRLFHVDGGEREAIFSFLYK